MPRTIFPLPWVSKDTFVALAESAKNVSEDAFAREKQFVSQLIIQLLDQQREGELSDLDLYSFYAFCQQRINKTYSQIFQDLWVLFMLNEKRSGYFVEFGACDGVLLSNTLLLEQSYGWTGILAEPNPLWHNSLQENRSCHISHKCVFPESNRVVPFACIPSMPELSRINDIVPNDAHEHNGNRSIKDTINVSTISLQDLLQEHHAPKLIDYLSIDTEGSELAILQSLDFDAHQFQLISIEHAGDSEKRKGIRLLLEEHGYLRWHPELSRWDDWYTRRS